MIRTTENVLLSPTIQNKCKNTLHKEQAILLLSANKNCQLTDDRILLTEKTFILIFHVITIADPLITPWMTISRPPSF